MTGLEILLISMMAGGTSFSAAEARRLKPQPKKEPEKKSKFDIVMDVVMGICAISYLISIPVALIYHLFGGNI